MNNDVHRVINMFGPLEDELEACFADLDIDPGTPHVEAMPRFAEASRECGFQDVHADHIPGADQPTETNDVIFDESFDVPGPGRAYVEYDSHPHPGRSERTQLRQGLRGLRPVDELYHVTPRPSGGVNVDRVDEKAGLLDRILGW